VKKNAFSEGTNANSFGYLTFEVGMES